MIKPTALIGLLTAAALAISFLGCGARTGESPRSAPLPGAAGEERLTEVDVNDNTPISQGASDDPTFGPVLVP